MSNFRKATLIADMHTSGERLDRFLVQGLEGVSRKAIKKALDGGQVFVDGRCERRAGLLLQGNETLLVTVEAPAPPAESPELTVLFRDAALLAINKPAGLPAHPTVAGRTNALDLVTERLRKEGRSTPPILLHRLDADTTGVLLFALTPAANRAVALQFADHQVEKVYLAWVSGAPPEQFIVTNHLKPGVRGRTVAVASGGQPSETAFHTLQKVSPPLTKGGEWGFALVEARPKSGRTHQIRTHLAGAGFPLLGDPLYGGPIVLELSGQRLPLPRHLLHASQLTFTHPESNERMTIAASLPEDFTLLAKLTRAAEQSSIPL